MMSQRVPVDRSRVIRAALAIADADGLEAVTMRSVAQQLGVVPMALYKHVANKDDLVARMIDAVIEGWEPPATGIPWRQSVEHRIDRARSSMRQRPWLREAMTESAPQTRAVLGHLDAIAESLFAGGFGAELVHFGMHALGPRVWGVSAELFQGAPTSPLESDADRRAFTEEFPHVARIATEAIAIRGGCDPDDEFWFTLRLSLDGLERLRDSGWHPADSTVSTP